MLYLFFNKKKEKKIGYFQEKCSESPSSLGVGFCTAQGWLQLLRQAGETTVSQQVQKIRRRRRGSMVRKLEKSNVQRLFLKSVFPRFLDDTDNGADLGLVEIRAHGAISFD